MGKTNPSKGYNIKYLTSRNCRQVLSNNEKPIVLCCYSEGCPNCQEMKPVFEAAAANHRDLFTFAKVIVDEEPNVNKSFKIDAIPTLLFMYQGVRFGKIVGYLSPSQLEQVLRNFHNLICPQKSEASSPVAKC